MKKYNYLIPFLVLLLILSGCKTYKTYMSSPSSQAYLTKMPTLTYSTSYNNATASNVKFVDDIVRPEIYNNAIEKSSTNYGSIEVTYNQIKAQVIPAGVFVPFWGLYGIPMTISKVKLDVTFTIRDKKNNIVREYHYVDEEKSAVGWYYGKTKKVCLVEVTKNILNRLRRDYTNEASMICAKLKGYSSPQNTYYASNTPMQTTNFTNVTQLAVSSDNSSQVKTKNKPKSDVDLNIPKTNKINDDTYVLIIANEEYQFLDNVNYATFDGEIFKEYCSKTLGIPDRQIHYCPNASYGIITGGVDWLTYALKNFEGSRAIVYYCGHGIPDEKTNEAYIIPVDGKGTNTATCYSLNHLYKTLAETKAASVTYFMDACFTGANKEGSMLVAARGVAREPKKETVVGNAIVFSASSGDETAMTYKEKEHGLFTYYLLKKLQETGGDVSYGDLASYISKNVKKDAFLLNDKPQTPVVATSPEAATSWESMRLK